jgi:replication factor C subunit 1
VQKTLEMDFRKATAQQVAARMHMVCRNEGLAINDASLQALIDGANGDIRLVLGQLQVRC